jgi:hypothetical protein
MTRPILVLVLVACLAGVRGEAAPAPFPRTPKPSASKLHECDLAGAWEVRWGYFAPMRMVLARDGSYTCDAGSCRFVGVWWLDHQGRLCIRETIQPAREWGWQEYAIRLDPATLRGRFEAGSPGTEFGMRRRR